MKLSIVIPTHNGSTHLPTLFESITVAERPKETEIIVCDDGSTEDIRAAIEQLTTDRLSIIYQRQPRQGERRGAARNLGIRVARGDVLFFLDGDQVVRPDTFALHLQWHQRYKQRLVFGYRHRLPSYTELEYLASAKTFVPNDFRVGIPELSAGRLPDAICPWYYAYTGNMSVSKACLPVLFDETFTGWGCEDIEFAYRVWRAGAALICEPKALVLHVDQPDLTDPYVNRTRGKPADFTSVTINTVRMLLKFPDDEALQTKLLSTLTGMVLVDDTIRSCRGADQVERIIAWARERIYL